LRQYPLRNAEGLHPLIPFVTEEIAASLKPYVNEKEEFLLNTSYPVYNEKWVHADALEKMTVVQGITKEIRTIRSQYNVPPALKITAVISAADEKELTTVKNYAGYIQLMAKVETLTVGINQTKPAQTATATFGNITVYVPLTGLIDFEKERKRLEKDISKAKANIASRQARLSQENFLKNAPQEQIDKTKAELAAAELSLAQATAALEDLA